MTEYFQQLARSGLMQQTLLAGLLASVACGVVGSYVVVRRITYIAGGIAHCVLGGIGGAIYLRSVMGWSWLSPLHGALVAALAAAGIIGLVSLRLQQREDTVISAMWALGMSTGLIFLTRTPEYTQDLMTYLFGNVLLVSQEHLWLLLALDVGVLGVALGFYKQFLAVCCDEQFARTRGVRVDAVYMLLLMITAVTVVLLTTVVGILLVIALLTIPVAVAGQFARRLWQMMLLATLLAAGFTVAGLALSYEPDLPPGAFIVVLAAGVYFAVTLGRWVWSLGSGRSA
ncbi:MAG: metal ABC transporter permease [Phycisphaerae bacterium]